MKSQADAKVFKTQVSKRKYPQYYKVIKEPMWLDKVWRKLESEEYLTLKAFDRDMMLIWHNARTFNPPTHAIHNLANEMQDQYQSLLDQYQLLEVEEFSEEPQSKKMKME